MSPKWYSPDRDSSRQRTPAACCYPQCMRRQKSLPLKETSSTIKRTTFPLCFSREHTDRLSTLVESGVRANAEGRTCSFGTEPDVEGGASVRSQLHGCFDAFLGRGAADVARRSAQWWIPEPAEPPLSERSSGTSASCGPSPWRCVHKRSPGLGSTPARGQQRLPASDLSRPPPPRDSLLSPPTRGSTASRTPSRAALRCRKWRGSASVCLSMGDTEGPPTARCGQSRRSP